MTKRLLLIALAALLLPLSLHGQGAGVRYERLFGREPYIVIDKNELVLRLYCRGVLIKEYGVACAKNYGNKHVRGDSKTPEGMFVINEILESSTFPHDFGDGKGPIYGAYGPWFMRLDVPGFWDIGIHGTHLPESIGTRATEGCIRLRNEDVDDLRHLVHVGTPVVIVPDRKR